MKTLLEPQTAWRAHGTDVVEQKEGEKVPRRVVAECGSRDVPRNFDLARWMAKLPDLVKQLEWVLSHGKLKDKVGMNGPALEVSIGDQRLREIRKLLEMEESAKA